MSPVRLRVKVTRKGRKLMARKGGGAVDGEEGDGVDGEEGEGVDGSCKQLLVYQSFLYSRQ
jgi:hypothetical protein